jgi:hypothetical protein
LARTFLRKNRYEYPWPNTPEVVFYRQRLKSALAEVPALQTQLDS